MSTTWPLLLTLAAVAIAGPAPSTASDQRPAATPGPWGAAALSGAVVLPALGLTIAPWLLPTYTIIPLAGTTFLTMWSVGVGQGECGDGTRAAYITAGVPAIFLAGFYAGFFGLTPLLPPLGSRFGQPTRSVESAFFIGLSTAALGVASYGAWSAWDAYGLAARLRTTPPVAMPEAAAETAASPTPSYSNAVYVVGGPTGNAVNTSFGGRPFLGLGYRRVLNSILSVRGELEGGTGLPVFTTAGRENNYSLNLDLSTNGWYYGGLGVDVTGPVPGLNPADDTAVSNVGVYLLCGLRLHVDYVTLGFEFRPTLVGSGSVTPFNLIAELNF